MKLGVYLNTYKDRNDLVIVHNLESLPECKDLYYDDFNVTLVYKRDKFIFKFKDLVYIGAFK